MDGVHRSKKLSFHYYFRNTIPPTVSQSLNLTPFYVLTDRVTSTDYLHSTVITIWSHHFSVGIEGNSCTLCVVKWVDFGTLSQREPMSVNLVTIRELSSPPESDRLIKRSLRLNWKYPRLGQFHSLYNSTLFRPHHCPFSTFFPKFFEKKKVPRRFRVHLCPRPSSSPELWVPCTRVLSTSPSDPTQSVNHRYLSLGEYDRFFSLLISPECL